MFFEEYSAVPKPAKTSQNQAFGTRMANG